MFNRKNKSEVEKKLSLDKTSSDKNSLDEYITDDDGVPYPVYNAKNLDAALFSNIKKLERYNLSKHDYDVFLDNMMEISDYIVYVEKNIRHNENIPFDKISRIVFTKYSDSLVRMLDEKRSREQPQTVGRYSLKLAERKKKQQLITPFSQNEMCSVLDVFEDYLHIYDKFSKSFNMTY